MGGTGQLVIKKLAGRRPLRRAETVQARSAWEDLLGGQRPPGEVRGRRVCGLAGRAEAALTYNPS